MGGDSGYGFPATLVVIVVVGFRPHWWWLSSWVSCHIGGDCRPASHATRVVIVIGLRTRGIWLLSLIGRHLRFTAFMHIINCSVLGGMRVHSNFLGEHVCILYIAYHEYSMIDPSGTNISGTSLLWAATFACCMDRWRGVVFGRKVFEIVSVVAFGI